MALSERKSFKFFLIVLGLFAGGVIDVLAIMLGGAGHGWCSATISAISVVGASLAAFAWASRGTTGRVSSAIAVLIAVGGDGWLVIETLREGVSYLKKAVESLPVVFAVWVLIFIGWQALALVSVFRVEPKHR